MYKVSLLCCIWFVLALVACASGAGDKSVTESWNEQLQTYPTSTPSKTPTPWLADVEVGPATPTPFTYKVVANDTMSGIAERFGVSLQDLMAANPGIQPNAMSIGTVLVIPIGGNISTEPTPTPVPLIIRQSNCFPTAEGGLWCFVLAFNEYAQPLENLSVQVSLFDEAGQVVEEATAFALLNLLPPGRSMPMAVFFSPPLSPSVRPRVQLITAIRLLPEDSRYLLAFIENALVSVSWSGRVAQVMGRVVLPEASKVANLIWVLGVAYDRTGSVVGQRRWESLIPLSPGSSLEFEFQVASLGAEIDRVDLLVEARP